jgi:hypothetical protein
MKTLQSNGKITRPAVHTIALALMMLITGCATQTAPVAKKSYAF